MCVPPQRQQQHRSCPVHLELPHLDGTIAPSADKPAVILAQVQTRDITATMGLLKRVQVSTCVCVPDHDGLIIAASYNVLAVA